MDSKHSHRICFYAQDFHLANLEVEAIFCLTINLTYETTYWMRSEKEWVLLCFVNTYEINLCYYICYQLENVKMTW